MNYEINLPADCVLPCVNKRVKELKAAIKLLEKSLSESPEGVLYVSSSHGRLQWQCRVGGVKSFLSNSEADRINELAQKKYYELVLESWRKQYEALVRLRQDYHSNDGGEILASMRQEFRNLVAPLLPSGDQFVENWRKFRYRGKNLAGATLMSVDGVKVRSKSELLIADMMSASGVPYRYEFPYKMNWQDADGRESRVKVYPDFTCLNPHTRQEFVWEHFGMMDDSEYAQGAIEKLDQYERNGFVYGENFIFTMETRAKPLDSRRIQRVINKYFLK